MLRLKMNPVVFPVAQAIGNDAQNCGVAPESEMASAHLNILMDGIFFAFQANLARTMRFIRLRTQNSSTGP